MPYEIASSAEIFPVPDMRSTKMRLRVSSVSDSLRTRRVSSSAFRHRSAKPSGRSPFTPPTRQVRHGQPGSRHHLDQFPEKFPGLDHVEKDWIYVWFQKSLRRPDCQRAG